MVAFFVVLTSGLFILMRILMNIYKYQDNLTNPDDSNKERKSDEKIKEILMLLLSLNVYVPCFVIILQSFGSFDGYLFIKPDKEL